MNQICGMILLTLCCPCLSVSQDIYADSAKCGYDTCAIRLTYNAFGFGLVRGLDGERISRNSILDSGLAGAVSSSTVALDYALRFERLNRYTLVAGGLAGVMVGLALVDRMDDNVRRGLIIGSAVTVGISIPIHVRSRNYLSKSIWEYNRSLHNK